ncbi:uncharacterized protein DEA37_0003125 [Paragonimus westermani]|uniref:G-protein coupled receptors family 1 profile domain-containing protein n=1 Tax=Paragonimus westermani TaxID=34504 RepID=A0A5J4NPF4_9TREM|nr:uncharacterized protein DEA37_0003125 [Paragonimus westermani]
MFSGNLLSLYILHPFRTRISGHIYLACLAVFDTLSLVFYMMSFWNILVLIPYLYQRGNYDTVNLIQRHFMSQGRCELRVYLNFLFRMLSVWTVVVLSMERFLLIVSPLRFYKVLRPRLAWITMGLCALIAGLTSTPWLFSFSYVEKYQCITATSPQVSYLRCVPNEIFFASRLIECTLITIVPAVLLLVANTQIAITLSQRRKIWLRMNPPEKTDSKAVVQPDGSSAQIHALEPDSLMAEGHRTAQRSERRLTIRLFMVAVVFLVLSTPSMILVAVHTYYEYQHKKNHLRGPLADAHFISQLLFATNLAINFIIYCVTGRTFRRALWALITCRWRLVKRLRSVLETGIEDQTDENELTYRDGDQPAKKTHSKSPMSDVNSDKTRRQSQSPPELEL